MTILNLEDKISGAIESAFAQFQLVIETILEAQDQPKALKNLKNKFLDSDLEKIITHVFRVRGRYILHAHPNDKEHKKLIIDHKASLNLARQILVVRWAARKLISLELGINLTIREMRLYTSLNKSIEFVGSPESLDTDFKI